ncbi:MAG: lysophospholipid acyltransferase family protein [Oleiphilaceae bacterium]|nr:lysophospholipid acyltransferase family protein [Oleiphilaceae bacterium]
MDKFKAKLVILILKILATLSLAQAQALGRFLGRLVWMGDSSLVRVTRRNIELCYPELQVEEQQAMIKASLQETGKLFAELGIMWEWPTDKTLGLIKSVKGKEHFDAIAAKGKGVIVLAPHHGNWELVGLYLSTLRPMAALYKPPKLKPLEDYMSAVRGRHGSELVPTNKRGVIRLFSILNEQGMVGILPDQVPGGSGGLFAPFMGVPANTIKLVTRLIHKTDCEVVSLCAMRLPKGDGFELIFRPVDPDIYSEDIETSVAAMNRSIEDCVRDRPEQYQWEYKRFKDYRIGSNSTYGENP